MNTAADTTCLASSHHHQAAHRSYDNVHVGWLVRPQTQGKGVSLTRLLTCGNSVVVVSVIWIIVLSKLEVADVTCKSTRLSSPCISH